MSNSNIRCRLVIPALVEWEEGEVVGLRSSVVGQSEEKQPAGGFTIRAEAADEGEARPTAQDAKRRGEIVEVRLALDAMEHDYICAKPYTSEAFDLFVMPRVVAGPRSRGFETVASSASVAKADQLSNPVTAALKRSPSERHGDSLTERKKRVKIEVARVQVRSAHVPNPTEGERTPVYKVSFTHGTDNRKYTREDIDVLAVYVAPKRLWYVIPFEEIADARTLAFYPDDPASKGQYEKFKERWDLLTIE